MRIARAGKLNIKGVSEKRNILIRVLTGKMSNL